MMKHGGVSEDLTCNLSSPSRNEVEIGRGLRAGMGRNCGVRWAGNHSSSGEK